MITTYVAHKRDVLESRIIALQNDNIHLAAEVDKDPEELNRIISKHKGNLREIEVLRGLIDSGTPVPDGTIQEPKDLLNGLYFWIKREGGPVQVHIRDYVKAKRIQLMEIGYESLTRDQMWESVRRVLDGNGNTIVDRFVAEDILIGKGMEGPTYLENLNLIIQGEAKSMVIRVDNNDMIGKVLGKLGEQCDLREYPFDLTDDVDNCIPDKNAVILVRCKLTADVQRYKQILDKMERRVIFVTDFKLAQAVLDRTHFVVDMTTK